ncbi:unnamed protein product [Aspergillus oryzae]|nr:unnamed protein product [Aspergillus oryzae]
MGTPAFPQPTRHMHIVPSSNFHVASHLTETDNSQWRHYPYNEGNSAGKRRVCVVLPSPIPHGDPAMANCKLPLPLDDPCDRQGDSHSQRHAPMEAHQPFRGPMNEKPFDPARHAALPEYQPQVYFPQEPRSNSDAPAPLRPHSKPPAPCSTLVIPTSHALASYDSGSYQSQTYVQAKIQESSAPKAPRTSIAPESKNDSLDMLQRLKAKDDNIATAQKQLPEWSGAATDQHIRPGKDDELSIPVEHTTAAHKLLLWPSIQNLLLPRRYDDDYITKLEEQRGLICVYGRGEGDETSEDNSPSAAPTNSSTGCDEDEPYYVAASPGDPWGVEAKQEQAKLANKGIDEKGILTINADDVHCYHRSYMKHIHQLHPFLGHGFLENMINRFIRINCPQTCFAANSEVPNKHANKFPRGRKRKHLYEDFKGTGCDVQFHAGQESYQRIEYSVHNAIVLLVLALGSICEANPVPGPVTDYTVDFRQEMIPGPAGSDYGPHPQGNRRTTKTSKILMLFLVWPFTHTLLRFLEASKDQMAYSISKQPC